MDNLHFAQPSNSTLKLAFLPGGTLMFSNVTFSTLSSWGFTGTVTFCVMSTPGGTVNTCHENWNEKIIEIQDVALFQIF